MASRSARGRRGDVTDSSSFRSCCCTTATARSSASATFHADGRRAVADRRQARRDRQVRARRRAGHAGRPTMDARRRRARCGRRAASTTIRATFTSGIVWRPTAGGELRLLFPDRRQRSTRPARRSISIATRTSSAPRAADAIATTRAAGFNRDAQETCDGFDTNCDGAQSLVVACTGEQRQPVPDATTEHRHRAVRRPHRHASDVSERPGVPLCGESEPRARVARGLRGSADVGNVKPCQPGVGTLVDAARARDRAVHGRGARVRGAAGRSRSPTTRDGVVRHRGDRRRRQRRRARSSGPTVRAARSRRAPAERRRGRSR